ncbi:hypothetical protein [Bacillus badius]|uniref:Phage protein n=1 Tax=Bacillus badius TaxID=1455 RepID=A0ABR5ANV9_BACBA|nr:hypothetical protein [Bacillus badius]KIL72706.1 hypothetical protein SD77_3441 [Bacillus badius]MED4715447.1 hypothetical protein [Bacillus badius]
MGFYRVNYIHGDYFEGDYHEIGIYADLEKAFLKADEFIKENTFYFNKYEHLLVEEYELVTDEYKVSNSWLKNDETNWEWEEEESE